MNNKEIKRFYGYVANILGVSVDEIQKMKMTEINSELKQYNLDLNNIKKQYEIETTLYQVNWPKNFTFQEKTIIFQKLEKYKDALLNTNIFHTNINNQKIRVTLDKKNINVERL